MRSLPLSLVLLCTVACGTTQRVAVASMPAGAAISVDCGVPNDPALVTPAVVTVHRQPDTCTISLAKEGYQPAAVVLRKTRSKSWFGNAVAAVLTGRAGNMEYAYDRTPAEITVELVKQ